MRTVWRVIKTNALLLFCEYTLLFYLWAVCKAFAILHIGNFSGKQAYHRVNYLCPFRNWYVFILSPSCIISTPLWPYLPLDNKPTLATDFQTDLWKTRHWQSCGGWEGDLGAQCRSPNSPMVAPPVRLDRAFALSHTGVGKKRSEPPWTSMNPFPPRGLNKQAGTTGMPTCITDVFCVLPVAFVRLIGRRQWGSAALLSAALECRARACQLKEPLSISNIPPLSAGEEYACVRVLKGAGGVAFLLHGGIVGPHLSTWAAAKPGRVPHRRPIESGNQIRIKSFFFPHGGERTMDESRNDGRPRKKRRREKPNNPAALDQQAGRRVA